MIKQERVLSEMSLTEWNHKVCKMMDHNSLELQEALLYLNANGFQLSKATEHYKKILKITVNSC